jgi:hypothetical protein
VGIHKLANATQREIACQTNSAFLDRKSYGALAPALCEYRDMIFGETYCFGG